MSVKGLVLGCFGEASQATHDLIYHLAVSRVQVAGPQRARSGKRREEQAEIALMTSFLRRTVSVCAVKAQAFSLLGRLESLGSGTSEASVKQGRSILRRGQFGQN